MSRIVDKKSIFPKEYHIGKKELVDRGRVDEKGNPQISDSDIDRRQYDKMKLPVAIVGINRFADNHRFSSIDNGVWGNKEYVLNAVKKDGFLLKHADRLLKEDKEVVLTAVKQNGFALHDVVPLLKKDKEVVCAALKQDKYAFFHADSSLKKDKEFVLNAIKKFGLELQYVDDLLKNDKEVVLAAVKQNGHALYYAGHLLKNDKELVLSAMKEDGYAIVHADSSLKKDKEFVLSAMKQFGWGLQYVDSSFREDQEVVLAAVKQNGHALQFASPSVLGSEEVLLAAVKQSISLLDNKSLFHLKTKIWWLLKKDLDSKKKFNFPETAWKTYESFKGYLKKNYNIEFVGRLDSIDTIVHVINVRNDPTNSYKPKPLTLIIMPKADWNNAFSGSYEVNRFVELGYKVAYFEVSNEKEVQKVLFEGTGGGKIKANIIVLGGHGNSTSLALGDKDLGQGGKMSDEEFYIDTSDFGKMGNIDINLSDYIEPNGEVVLKSCSNGKGKSANPENLANTIYSTLPKTVTLHSADRPTNIWKISLGKDGKVIVKWAHGADDYIPGSEKANQ